jgi:hypothetical protein
MQESERSLFTGLMTCAVVALAGCAHRPEPSGEPTHAPAHDVSVAVSGTPDALKAPDDQVLTVTARGIGVQIYQCQASPTNAAAFVWTLKGPEAQLRYDGGKELGRHYAGPTWEANDGSKVVGEVVAHDDGLDATAIPLLLLRAKQASGDGVFGKVESIQRLHTVGGRAPTTGCDASYGGTEARVAYTADYYFYSARP